MPSRRGPSLLAALAAVGALAACGSSGDGGADRPAQTQAGAAPAAGATTATTPAAGGTADGTCREVTASAPKGEQTLDAPTTRLRAADRPEVVFTTSCGRFTVRLDVRDDPRTSASVASLVERGFYDGLTFHRVVPGFVIQGGDPLGNGSGDAGYDVVEPPASDETYPRGTVAMAKTATQAPGTSSSQFFVTLADGVLTPDYAVLGRVTSGLDTTVDAIAKLGDASSADGTPTRPVVIESAKLVSR